MTTDELKPCPFCGCTPDVVARPDNAAKTEFFAAVTCYCDGYSARAYQNARRNTQDDATAEALAAWNRRAQPEPAASADPSRDAYEGCREDLLDWKRRALKAEETCRQLTRALGDEVNGPTLMGEPVLPAAAPADAAPSVAPEPVAWRYQDARGHYRYRAYKPGFDVEYAILKPVPLYAAHPPRAPLTDEEIDCLRSLDTDRRVRFYEHDFYVLSNFSAFTLYWRGERFDTSEAAYHFEKFPRDANIRQQILKAPSAHEAFKIAERYKKDRRPDWDTMKVDVMREILRTKARQHEYVRRKLLATGDRELVEDSWRDDFWGWGPNRDGQNMLGKLWMEVRAELRDSAHGINAEGEKP